MNQLDKHKNIAITVLVYFILYAAISLINHYTFRTYALDLGAYTNALFDYLRLQWNDSGVFKAVSENLLADHFDLYLIFFSPLSLLFGTYTLLIVQILAVLFGGIGVYAFFLKQKGQRFSIIAACYFYSFFGVFAALSFDYHSNVVAAALLPWFFYLIRKGSMLKAFLFLLFLLVSKENVSLWLLFVCLALGVERWKEARLRNALFGMAIFSGFYFIFITTYVMPALSNSGSYPHFYYSFLGDNYVNAMYQLLKHPIDAFKVLFSNHMEYPNGDYVKTELHLLLLVSGLPLLLKKPWYILMLLPIYFQKLFHDNIAMWGIGGQYTIEFAPILSIGIFSVIAELKNKILRTTAMILVLFFSIAATLRTMDNTVYYTNKARIRFYQKKHYVRDYDIQKVHRQLRKIPKSAIVSVQSPFLPHLALREDVYQFPIIKDAEYIVFSMKEKTYPMTKNEFIDKTRALINSNEWKMLQHDEALIILKKKVN